MEIVDYLLARKKAGGGGSAPTIEQLSVTENGTYSEQGMAYSPVVVNVPAPENSYQLTDIPAGTVSTIEDGTDLPMSSLKVGIEPVQDLHGYDHPWAGGAGKNKLQVTATSQTIAGVTITVKDDGTFIANGTATQNISLQLSRKNVNDTPLPEGQLTMTGCPSGGSTSSYYLTCWRTNSGNANDVGGGVTFGYRSDWDFVVSLIITSGTTCNNLTFKPMIRLATETDPTYEPYSNICPISGWTAANVIRTGKNLCNPDINAWNVRGYIYFKLPKFSNDRYIMSFVDKDTSVDLSGVYFGFMYNYPDANSQYRWTMNNGVIQDNRTNISQIDGTTKCDTLIIYPSTQSTFEKIFARFNVQVEKDTTATTYEPYNGTTYSIQFTDGDNPLTVYGGTLDVTTGELVVDRAETDLGEMTWRKSSDDIFWSSNDLSQIAKTYPNNVPNKVIFEKYESKPSRPGGYYPNEPNTISLNANGVLYTTSETAPTGQCIYELAEPVTYHLTPTQVRTLVGSNNIWADTGDIIEGKYFKEL